MPSANRPARIALGALLVAAFFAWLLLRWTEPFQEWANSGTLTGWLLHGAAWASLLGGVALWVAAWPFRAGEREDAAGDG